MRCVERGPVPQDQAGQALVFSKYQDAAPYLKDRLGRYCSFCERWIATQLAVEHKRPKASNPHLERSWHNFLLACANCNSSKSTQDALPGAVFWPDEDDSFSALDYLPSGRIRPREGMDAPTTQRAQQTLDLTGLSKPPLATPGDHRWPDRLEVWRQAEASRKQLLARDTDQMRELIVQSALTRGGFSIWMTVFANDPAMRAALISAFPGTVMRGTAAPPCT